MSSHGFHVHGPHDHAVEHAVEHGAHGDWPDGNSRLSRKWLQWGMSGVAGVGVAVGGQAFAHIC